MKNKILLILVLLLSFAATAQVHKHHTKVQLKTVDELASIPGTTKILIIDSTSDEIKYVTATDLLALVTSGNIYTQDGAIPASTDREVTIPSDSSINFVNGDTEFYISNTDVSIDSQNIAFALAVDTYINLSNGSPLQVISSSGVNIKSGTSGAAELSLDEGLGAGSFSLQAGSNGLNSEGDGNTELIGSYGLQIRPGVAGAITPSVVGQVLTATGTNGETNWQTPATGANLYNSDGTILTTVEREVTIEDDASITFVGSASEIWMAHNGFSIDTESWGIGSNNGGGSINSGDGSQMEIIGAHGMQIRPGSGGTFPNNTVGQVLTAIGTNGEVNWQDASSSTASNGLTESTGNIKLGGTLIETTSIDTDTQDLEIGSYVAGEEGDEFHNGLQVSETLDKVSVLKNRSSGLEMTDTETKLSFISNDRITLSDNSIVLSTNITGIGNPEQIDFVTNRIRFRHNNGSPARYATFDFQASGLVANEPVYLFPTISGRFVNSINGVTPAITGNVVIPVGAEALEGYHVTGTALTSDLVVTLGDEAGDNNATTFVIDDLNARLYTESTLRMTSGLEFYDGSFSSTISDNGGVLTANQNLYVPNATGTLAIKPEYGGFGFEGNATATTIAATNTYVKVDGTTAVTNTSSDITYTNGRLTYTGANDRHFTVNANFSVTVGANNQIVDFKIAKNGTVEGFAARRKINSSTDIGAMSLAFDLILSTGDYVELFAENETSTNDITVEELYFSILGTL